MINKVILIGNLGADPEIRSIDSNIKVAKLRIATNESYRDKKGDWQTVTEWHNVSAWRGLAEKAERDLRKGSLVFVEGKLTHRKYLDKDDVERYITDVYAFTLRLLEKREQESSTSTHTFKAANTQSNKSTSNDSSDETTSGNEPGEEDDLPF
ncbi:MAG: single-stranded DNA-binding protein [Saprospirales bacterium]|nr:MAG: single-stranded DNA-binding protein [Saprospirales bacterium]